MKELDEIIKKLSEFIIAMSDGVTLITAIYQYFLKIQEEKKE